MKHKKASRAHPTTLDSHTPRWLREQIGDRIVIFRGEGIAWGPIHSKQECYLFCFLGYS
jgi:hypothetical protein